MSKCRAGEADSFCVARLHKLGATDFRSERVRTTDAQTPAISIRGLTKQYGSLTALKDLNLEVVQGEVLGFLGLNGAGKTTAIRLLLDLLRPTSGKAFIFGHDCWTEGLAARARVGYLPGELGLYPDLTGFEVLDFLAGISRQAVDKRRRQELFDRLELPHSDLRRKLRQYSTGMKPSRQLAPRRIRVFFKQDVRVPPDLPPGHEFVETFPQTWHLNVVGPLGPLLAVLARLPVKDVEVQEARLEDVVLKYYREGAS